MALAPKSSFLTRKRQNTSKDKKWGTKNIIKKHRKRQKTNNCFYETSEICRKKGMGTEDKLCGCEKGNIRCDIGWTQLVEWEGNLQEIPKKWK